ncbi:MAG: hypothetical protein R6W78_06330 [Bacteroidales bacterium]
MNLDMNIWTLITGTASIIGVIIAIFQYVGKRNLSRFLRSTLRGIAGNVCMIQQSANWGENKFRELQKIAIQLPDSKIKNELILKISEGQGDSTAADRMITNLLNDLLTSQEGQFGTKIINHPRKNEFTLVKD